MTSRLFNLTSLIPEPVPQMKPYRLTEQQVSLDATFNLDQKYKWTSTNQDVLENTLSQSFNNSKSRTKMR